MNLVSDTFILDGDQFLYRGGKRQGCPYQQKNICCGNWCPHFKLIPNIGTQPAFVELKCSPQENIILIEKDFSADMEEAKSS